MGCKFMTFKNVDEMLLKINDFLILYRQSILLKQEIYW